MGAPLPALAAPLSVPVLLLWEPSAPLAPAAVPLVAATVFVGATPLPAEPVLPDTPPETPATLVAGWVLSTPMLASELGACTLQPAKSPRNIPIRPALTMGFVSICALKVRILRNWGQQFMLTRPEKTRCIAKNGALCLAARRIRVFREC
jgi:hypothetical protein